MRALLKEAVSAVSMSEVIALDRKRIEGRRGRNIAKKKKHIRAVAHRQVAA